jgi:hypothetical protein
LWEHAKNNQKISLSELELILIKTFNNFFDNNKNLFSSLQKKDYATNYFSLFINYSKFGGKENNKDNNFIEFDLQNINNFNLDLLQRSGLIKLYYDNDNNKYLIEKPSQLTKQMFNYLFDKITPITTFIKNSITNELFAKGGYFFQFFILNEFFFFNKSEFIKRIFNIYFKRFENKNEIKQKINNFKVNQISTYVNFEDVLNNHQENTLYFANDKPYKPPEDGILVLDDSNYIIIDVSKDKNPTRINKKIEKIKNLKNENINFFKFLFYLDDDLSKKNFEKIESEENLYFKDDCLIIIGKNQFRDTFINFNILFNFIDLNITHKINVKDVLNEFEKSFNLVFNGLIFFF